ncbi:GNAT family N-acetyltransferase [Mammaliicoccus stepanovicii]|uniref:Ribosomal-protein-L7p-serine acetyltransferase n=1 Tax=Mammaliicoccus stepanovicii TaxID=643214 RepID=A0A239ZI58_9STAP|nr:GNAT family protein [Mammaliicoccus stepanovicii]PNZ79046.1 GNAT family N-acetyltransferase [Mammaliicoccus stepanovicii]GGI41828.1 N-acetyltransferase [Mammaliicoccus stepanovicii]SNV70296.1 ribosomal-protein-L7p-serine acetyltransferase [Mammaliicoccus stepanovicii]
MIQTERLVLVPFQVKHLDDIYEILSNDETCQFLPHDPWTETNKDENFKKRLIEFNLNSGEKCHLAVMLNDKLIGDVVAWYTDMKDTVEIGYVFNKAFSNKGYATEAVEAFKQFLFKEYDLHRIQTMLDANNLSSANLCERIGMRKEGHFIKDYWNKGKWTDTLMYGLLASELK